MPPSRTRRARAEIERGLACSRASLAWLLPLAAIAVRAVRAVAQLRRTRSAGRASAFPTPPDGVVAGETRVRRNDVDVGGVEAVRLAEDLNSVDVEARMDPASAPYIDEDARFWIVNARVNTTEISGLVTLLSGRLHRASTGTTRRASARRVRRASLEPPLTKLDTPGLPAHAERRRGRLHPTSARRCSTARWRSGAWSGAGSRTTPGRCCSTSSSRRRTTSHVYPESSFYSVTGVEASGRRRTGRRCASNRSRRSSPAASPSTTPTSSSPGSSP